MYGYLRLEGRMSSSWIFSRARFLEVACLDLEALALNLEIKSCNSLIFSSFFLFASHDHQIVQTTANRIMEILPNGKLIDKITSYDEYLASDEMAKKRQVYSTEGTLEDN